MADKVTADGIIVPERAFKFLAIQRGKLAALATRKEAFIAAYRASLMADYNSIRHWLPALDIDAYHILLDVGGGMSGISLLINQHYGNHIIPCVLDGRKDRPSVTLHRRTFNDVDVTAEFHRANGVYPIAYVDANSSPLIPPNDKVSLVISIAAWCFHFAPDTYLDYVVDNVAPGATLIMDVRKDKPEWMKQLQSRLRWRATIHGALKYDRMVFHADK